jgi:hypothetical protein
MHQADLYAKNFAAHCQRSMPVSTARSDVGHAGWPPDMHKLTGSVDNFSIDGRNVWRRGRKSLIEFLRWMMNPGKIPD